jgi:hypothetical protein
VGGRWMRGRQEEVRLEGAGKQADGRRHCWQCQGQPVWRRERQQAIGEQASRQRRRPRRCTHRCVQCKPALALPALHVLLGDADDAAHIGGHARGAHGRQEHLPEELQDVHVSRVPQVACTCAVCGKGEGPLARPGVAPGEGGGAAMQWWVLAAVGRLQLTHASMRRPPSRVANPGMVTCRRTAVCGGGVWGNSRAAGVHAAGPLRWLVTPGDSPRTAGHRP